MMKAPYAIGLVITAVLITVLIEETRISGLRREFELSQSSPPGPANTVNAGTATQAESGRDAPFRTRSRAESRPESPAKPSAADEESMAKTVRKMWDNPAGKSMMNQGIKIAVAMMYEDFIEGLDLTKEEEDYFKDLLGKEMGSQQEMGMKLMNTSPEERKVLMEEMNRRKLENDEAIKTFLNNDEDYQSYTEYKARLPERQQLEGIRATMEGKGAPLDAATEARLVEAMHQVRTESAGPDFSGPDALQEMAKGNIVESFERNWQSQQEALRTATSEFLSPAQQEAFKEYQQNMKEMQLMGLKMAQKMLDGGKNDAE